jgi:hypothetical protein
LIREAARANKEAGQNSTPVHSTFGGRMTRRRKSRISMTGAMHNKARATGSLR